jgi:hypothetical protein
MAEPIAAVEPFSIFMSSSYGVSGSSRTPPTVRLAGSNLKLEGETQKPHSDTRSVARMAPRRGAGDAERGASASARGVRPRARSSAKRIGRSRAASRP